MSLAVLVVFQERPDGGIINSPYRKDKISVISKAKYLTTVRDTTDFELGSLRIALNMFLNFPP